MKIVINSKNYNASEKLKETIEKRNVTKNKENSNKETMVSFGMRRKGCFVCFKYGII